ncbi:hypothetical protein M2451_000893 [Dysgonomonas sp. PFB1-18]|uniref:hypothetical protein n=1 Tax=unclassified Dysgonomonas TaxID=2630389 RepID=UPI00247521ED|nr:MULTISPECIES: hypothetical protein [unclassified Dysgonomonas]MDH6308582.1 hypothetical protein [Dysgonomonas sp. PF1-14]MDH6338083.1 hypothetical protein [Dysgonomonas sp. PF1-16]MDH6379580.1 hypothetical protein [Dysgonomonas sp. PFB1-18]MDH6396910.1 hypothetical protein [Dysgonomonas sp. PF1-23]
MGIKQLLTLILLLSANILLLAHNVLPHSHHDGIVCFSMEELVNLPKCSDHSANNNDECCGNHTGKCHHHHHTNDDGCGLKEIVVRGGNEFHEEMLPCENCLSLLYTVYSLNEFYFDAPRFGQWLEQKPYLNNYVPPYVGTVSSLRAPPASYFLA